MDDGLNGETTVQGCNVHPKCRNQKNGAGCLASSRISDLGLHGIPTQDGKQQ